MDLNRVVDISFESSGSYGSGYLITNKLVLTAKHVAKPCVLRTECKITPLHWNGEAAKRSQHSRKASVTWLSESVDAALLEIMSGEEIPHLPTQSVQLGYVRGDTQDWRCRSIGFPAALEMGAENADRRLEGTLSWIFRENRHLIDVLNAAPEKAQLWRGFSGASVFVGDYLVGVIRTVEKSFKGRVLQATPISILFQDEVFKKHLDQNNLVCCELAAPAAESERIFLPHPAEFRNFSEFQDVLDALSRLSLNERHRELEVDSEATKHQSDYYSALAGSPDLPSLAASIIESSNLFPLNICGHHGSGRSSMLSALFTLLRQRCIERNIPVLYIDLNAYLPSEQVGLLALPPRHIGGPRYDPDQRTRMLINQLQRATYTFREHQVIVVVTGIDEDRYASEFRHRQRRGEIINALMKLPKLKMVIGSVQKASIQTALNRRWPSEIHDHYCLPDTTYEIDWIEKFTSKYSPIVDAYCRMERFNNPELIKDKIDKFSIYHIDTYILSQLVRNMRTGALNGHNNSCSFLEVYIDRRLRAELEDNYRVDIIDLASERAFKSLTRKVPPPSNPVEVAIERVLIEHVTVRDFLAARFMVDLLSQDLGSAPGPKYLLGIGHVFSNAINLFVCEILNANVERQDRILSNAEAVYKYFVGRLRTLEENGPQNRDTILGYITLCYTVGRLHKDKSTAYRSIVFLKKVKASIKQLRRQKRWWRTDQSALLLFRTVCISLSYLGDQDTTTEYIEILLSEPAEDNLNRGFYLEYYGDLIPQNSYRLHTYHDPLTDFSKTYRWIDAQINKQIRATSEHKSYNPSHDERNDTRSLVLNVSIQTLLSLVQHRHNAGRLSSADRMNARNLIDLLCSKYLVEDSKLRSFAQFVGVNLQLPSFPTGIAACELAKLKTVERCHWKLEGEREKRITRVESVAEHLTGACLLALLYIRDKSLEGEVQIDKAKLIMTLLVHDIVEAYTGDLGTKSDRDRTIDRDLIKYISLMQTYGELGSTSEILELYDDWGERRTPEGRIARDLDKLDALLQLHIYRNSVSENDFNTLCSEFSGDIRTEAGKRIRRVIEQYFSIPKEAQQAHQRDVVSALENLGQTSSETKGLRPSLR